MIFSGGYNNRDQLVKYEISHDIFVDFGVDYLSSNLSNSNGELGWCVYFTQINATTLFTINSNGGSINVYNLQSLSYDTLDTTIPTNVGIYGCMSSSESPSPKLYITGGYNSDSGTLNNLQVLSLVDLQWVSSPPSMLKAREQHGCVVVNDTLWAIGGYYVDSVEAINTTNIATETWTAIGSLNCELELLGVTAVNEMIFIVGGYCIDTGYGSDTVYTIDTVKNNISVNECSLPIAVAGMHVVVVDYAIYGFGGYIGSSSYSSTYLDSWMTLDLLRVLLDICPYVALIIYFCKVLYCNFYLNFHCFQMLFF